MVLSLFKQVCNHSATEADFPRWVTMVNLIAVGKGKGSSLVIAPLTMLDSALYNLGSGS